jgi:trimethylamine--corrinoid protein Co-methyltransferase
MQPPTPNRIQFRILSETQCQQLYEATLECLEHVGVLIHHSEARTLLGDAGARIEGSRTFIPRRIIQEALASTPRTFSLYGRDGNHTIQVQPGTVNFGPGPTCTYFYDPQTGERRHARRGDAAMTAQVCDALDNLDYIMSLSLFNDVTPILSPVYEFAEMIANSGKPIIAWATNPETLADIYEIAVQVAGGQERLREKPNFALFATYESPLKHAPNSIGNLLWAAEHGLPVIILGGPTVGLESPVTGASGLVLYLAAALSGLAIVQLKRRGNPIVIGGLPSAMDLRTARPSYGSPEMSLHVAAAAELAHFLGVPFMGTAGASESKRVDSQAALEISLQILTSALSGASLVHDVGFLDCADIGSLDLLVLSDEVIAMTRRMTRGIEVSPKTIMFDLIEKVGPGGHFMAEPESVALCRNEIWMPRLGDRSTYAAWEQKGSKSMETRIHERLAKILSTHQAPPLPGQVLDEIQAILRRAEERYR